MKKKSSRTVERRQEEIDKRLDGRGRIEGHWQGPTETALYIYGDSNAGMREAISGFLDEYPLCQGARVVELAPPPDEAQD